MPDGAATRFPEAEYAIRVVGLHKRYDAATALDPGLEVATFGSTH